MAQLTYFRRPGCDSRGSARWCSFATLMTSGVGSMAVTEDVSGSLAAEEAKMPPPQPMSRYAYCLAASGPSADVDRQDLMKS